MSQLLIYTIKLLSSIRQTQLSIVFKIIKKLKTNLKKLLAWLSDGTDNGRPSSTRNNVDFKNVFVGSYGAGDLQYKNHISLLNNNNIYWKETKNFQDGCSAHFSDSYYEHVSEPGKMALPGELF